MAQALVILTADAYDQIRGALDGALDESTLPNEVIDQGGFAAAAEQEVLAREARIYPTPIDPVAQGLHREQAAIYLTAARLAQALPALLSQQLGDARYTRTGFDAARRHASLRSLAERELAAYLDGTFRPHIMPAMWLAAGRRGA